MKKLCSNRAVRITTSLLVFGTSFMLFHCAPLNSVHGRSDAALIVAIFGILALLFSYIFNLNYLMATATLGYTVALLLGVLFNTDGLDGGGGATNNLWQIWLVSYWVFLGIGIMLDMIKKHKQPHSVQEVANTEPNDEHKYLILGILIGLPIGTVIAVIASILLGVPATWIGVGAALGMQFGIVVGATIDYERKRK